MFNFYWLIFVLLVLMFVIMHLIFLQVCVGCFELNLSNFMTRNSGHAKHVVSPYYSITGSFEKEHSGYHGIGALGPKQLTI